ncbi:MAG: response regulator, partial [Armatimonadota bacterium]|nr:response regulator [Armatimonadota bacterium]
MHEEKLRHAKILIVDDAVDNLELLQHILQFEGYANLAASADAREVLSLVGSFQPDLILLDLMMPHLDGFQIMEQLQPLIPAGTYLPILVITGDSSTEAKYRALASGAKDFLTKPFDPPEIRLRVRNLLETRFLHLQLQQQNCLLAQRADEELQRLKDHLQAVLDAAPVGISWIDQDLRYVGINPYLATTFNLTPADFIGREVGFQNTSSTFSEFVRGFMAGSEPMASREVEAQVLGETRIFWIIARKYQQGRNAVLVGIDITERQRAEAALRQARDELEARVQERTRELVEANTFLVREIAERQQAEKQLRLLGSAVTEANESILITTAALDLPGPEIVFVNPAFTRMTGYTVEEVM